MDDEDVDVAGQRDRVDGEARAVDAERVTRDPGGARELVHDPAGHAGGPLLDPLTELGQLERRAVEPEGEGDGVDERRRRRQAGPHGQLRRHRPGDAVCSRPPRGLRERSVTRAPLAGPPASVRMPSVVIRGWRSFAPALHTSRGGGILP